MNYHSGFGRRSWIQSEPWPSYGPSAGDSDWLIAVILFCFPPSRTERSGFWFGESLSGGALAAFVGESADELWCLSFFEPCGFVRIASPS